jgi:hypothetical protein
MPQRKDAPDEEATAFCLECETEPCQCDDDADDDVRDSANDGDSANG